MPEQYLVPQFIDIEDRIMGSITVRQFILMLVAALLMFIAFKLSDFTLFIVESLVIVIATGVLAFYKVNGMPFHFFLLNLVETLKKPNIRAWDKSYKPAKYKVKKVEEKEKKPEEIIVAKELPPSKLKDLSLIVNTGGVFKGTPLPVEPKTEPVTEQDFSQQKNELTNRPPTK